MSRDSRRWPSLELAATPAGTANEVWQAGSGEARRPATSTLLTGWAAGVDLLAATAMRPLARLISAVPFTRIAAQAPDVGCRVRTSVAPPRGRVPGPGLSGVPGTGNRAAGTGNRAGYAAATSAASPVRIARRRSRRSTVSERLSHSLQRSHSIHTYSTAR
jgi:hypothetical protein